jgi:hypothetical protein
MKNQFDVEHWQGVASLLITMVRSFPLCISISRMVWGMVVTARNHGIFTLSMNPLLVFLKKAHRWAIGFFERSFRCANFSRFFALIQDW